MKKVKEKVRCVYCEEQFDLILNYPSWYNYITHYLFIQDWLIGLYKAKLISVCDRCKKYQSLKEKYKADFDLMRYKKEREDFLKLVK